MDGAVFAYATDVPYLDNWGKPMLLGPGSITVAHTDAEFIEIAELCEAVERYGALLEAV
jgi:acetylornithine deacetylase